MDERLKKPPIEVDNPMVLKELLKMGKTMKIGERNHMYIVVNKHLEEIIVHKGKSGSMIRHGADSYFTGVEKKSGKIKLYKKYVGYIFDGIKVSK